MKSILTAFLIAAGASSAIAQETLQTVTDRGSSTNQNLKIGNFLQLQSGGVVQSEFAFDPAIQQMYLFGHSPSSFFSVYTAGARRFDITAGGNVGIGTANPMERLDVNGNVIWNGYKASNLRALSIGYSGGNYGGIGYNIDYTTVSGIFNRPLIDRSSYLEFASGGFNFYGNANLTSANGVNLNGGGDNLNLFAVITRTGDFGIGTTTPKEKLSVNGKIRAHEVKVETANWPDYVFEEGYKIKTLQELESYIKANKHLPEVPSAKDVAANGVELGEMNKILLKKIEELTLHLIEKEKEIEEERGINKRQEDRLVLLEEFIKNLKKYK